MYPEMSCFEIDVDGNQYPLTRFYVQPHFRGQDSGSGGRGRLHHNPTADKQLMKDVTDALRNKVSYYKTTYITDCCCYFISRV
jgi:hypothetical protein